ncbi:efflux RND transporter permease subunit, partial [Raoultella planticola]
AFFGGSTGVIYRQFSITVVSSMVLSVVLALTLAPALCATLLKPAHDAQTDKGLLGKFNRGYDRLQAKYADKVGAVIHRPTRYLLLYGLL